MKDPATAAPPARVEIVAIAESGLPELSRFVAEQTAASLDSVEARLRWFLLQNPAREDRTPLGWELRRPDGGLAGCLLCGPQLFRFRQSTLLLMGSSTFYVDAAHRGAGGMLFLQYSRLNAKWPLFGDSTNVESAGLWKARGASPIPNADHELLGVLEWKPLLEEILIRRGMNPGVSRGTSWLSSPFASVYKRLLFSHSESADLILLESAEQVLDLPIHGPPEFLTGARDGAYVHWRYFIRDKMAEVLAFRSAKSSDPILVTVNQRPRGYRGHIRPLNVLDVYPPPKPDVYRLIAGALAERYRGLADVIVFRGQNPACQTALCQIGFMRRPFDVPCAWTLDKSHLLPSADWYLVPADGDWIL